jgi:hypothetical protein
MRRYLGLSVALCSMWLMALAPAAVNNDDAAQAALALCRPDGVPVIVRPHFHCNYGDGLWTVDALAAMAQQLGTQVLVMTEHLDCLEASQQDFDRYILSDLAKTYRKMIPPVAKASGVANYVEACRQASAKYGLLVVPGVEVTIGGERTRVLDTAGGNGKDNVVHVLGIGAITPILCNELNAYLGTRLQPYRKDERTMEMGEAQEVVVRLLNQYGLAAVIAHPYLDDIFKANMWYTVYKNKPYDGVEFFNLGPLDTSALLGAADDKSLEALGLIKRDRYMGGFTRSLTPLAGADFHGLSSNENDHWRRFNIIDLPQPLTYRPERYMAECEIIAAAVRGGGVIEAFSEKYGTGNALLPNLYQRGQAFGRLDALTTAANFAEFDLQQLTYFHVPGQAMIRCVFEDAALNALAPSRTDPRAAPIATALARRQLDVGQLVAGIDTRSSANRPGEMVRPPNFRNYPVDLFGGMVLGGPNGERIEVGPIPILNPEDGITLHLPPQNGVTLHLPPQDGVTIHLPR